MCGIAASPAHIGALTPPFAAKHIEGLSVLVQIKFDKNNATQLNLVFTNESQQVQ